MFPKIPYCRRYALPSNIRYVDAPSKQYLQDLFNSVQLKDIMKRNKIRDVDLLERIIAYVIANVGTTFSASSLAKFLKSEKRTVSPETILNYIKYCCEAYLFYQVKREDLQGKQILSSNENIILPITASVRLFSAVICETSILF